MSSCNYNVIILIRPVEFVEPVLRNKESISFQRSVILIDPQVKMAMYDLHRYPQGIRYNMFSGSNSLVLCCSLCNNLRSRLMIRSNSLFIKVHGLDIYTKCPFIEVHEYNTK